MQKLRVALLAASTLGASVLFYAANPAHADVDAVAGSAFGASITSSLLGPVLVPSPPGVAGSATEPADSFGPINAQNCPVPVSTTICVQVPGVLSLGALNAGTQGGGVAGENHLGFATSTASVANIAVGSVGAGLFAQAISSTCTADGNGARGSTTVLGGVLGTNPILQSPAAGTMLEIPGVLQVVLNEQLPIPPATTINSPGSAGIIVNGARITLLPAVAGLPVLEIILAQSVCAAAGPNVNQTTTTSTSSTVPPSSTTSSSVVPPSSTTSSSVVPPSSTTSSSVVPPSSTTSSSVVPPSSTTSSSVVPPSSTTTSSTTTPPGGGNVSNVNICNAGSGGNGAPGAGIGGNAVAIGGGTANGGAGAGVGGAGGSGGNACNGLGGFINNGAIGSFNGLIPGGLGNVNICNAGNGGNGGAGLGVGGTGASLVGTATGGAGAGIGGAAGDGGDACNVTIAAATTVPGATTTIPGSGGGAGGAGGAGGGGGAGGAGGGGGAGGPGVGLLARTGTTMAPVALMALMLTVLGMLMFFGSQGLPDQAARLFTSHPMFRPVAAGGARAIPAGATGRLDGAALDALAHMEDTGGPRTDGPPAAQGRSSSWQRRFFNQRPW